MTEYNNTRWGQFLIKNRYLLLLLLAGLFLIMLPGTGENKEKMAESTQEELRLKGALQSLEGVGDVYVLLAEEGGRNGGYSGAVILCQGANDAAVRLQIVEAVSAFTGMGSNRIIVLKMKS